MPKLPALYLAVLLSTLSFFAYSQQKTVVPPIGKVKGIVRDTSQNYVLKSATVSVYKAADSALLSYQVTNNYGEFSFTSLPVDLLLRLEISNVGYLTTRKNFTIPSDKNALDLKTLIATQQDILLDDVVISVPPMSMNGDTLEFNASAFKLDSNATVEDMLRAIPNVTLWGDGQITVNGTEVKSLKVNGKSFFGGDAKIAIQNISKNALQKVQVYNTAKSQSNPLDSILEMNLKLKKGKDIGFFGKIGAGYGTNNRFESDANFNIFTPKMQLALVGAINNVNKTPNSVNSMMENSTFKGINTNVDYQPNFRESGINRPSAAGASLTYNFIENPTWSNKSTLRSDYFIQGRNTDFLSESITTTTINNTEKVFENSLNTSAISNNTQRFDSNYEFMKQGNALRLSQSASLNKGQSVDQNFRTASNLENPLTSTNNSLNTNDYNNSSFNLRGEYQYNTWSSGKRFRGFNLAYELESFDNQNKRSNMTEFKSFVNTGTNQKFNRKYDTNTDGLKQVIDFTLNDLKTIFFGDRNFNNFSFNLTNKLILNSNKSHDQVEDLDTLTNMYRPNAYLNNRIRTNVVEETPGLQIQKSFHKQLSNRYSKSLTLRLHPKQLLISQNNKSDRSFQNLKRNYQRFVPDGGIDYTNTQNGEYSRYYSVNYYTTLQIPNIYQLTPLIDSTNVYYVQRGNVNLRAAVQQQISLSFSHNDQRSKNELNYYFGGSVGLINDNIVDSLLIDDQNRQTVFLVNADGHRFLNFYGNLKKAFKFKSSQLQISLNNNFNFSKNPGYTNNVFTFSSNLNTNTDATVNYTYKAYMAVELGQNYSTYKSAQEAFDTKFSGKNLGTSLSASFNITKKLTVNSNIRFNNASSSNTKDINFTIWNANVVYRFLKGNNAEMKFSALDLLHQNSSIINYGSPNSFTIGTQNVLKQYFMTTISYYPRQFGKKSAKK